MEESKYQILKEIEKETDLNKLVSILEVTANKLGINTISEMARLEEKSPNGVRESKKYRKVRIGVQLMCIKGLDDINLPF